MENNYEQFELVYCNIFFLHLNSYFHCFDYQLFIIYLIPTSEAFLKVFVEKGGGLNKRKVLSNLPLTVL